MVAPFLAIFGLSYFFVEFGPNMTTFVLPSEVFPVSMRTTGHGIAAGVGKLGAFVGVFLVPQLQKHYGLRGMLTIAGVAAILGFALTTILPEPARRSLEDMHDEPETWSTSSPNVSPAQIGGVFRCRSNRFPADRSTVDESTFRACHPQIKREPAPRSCLMSVTPTHPHSSG